MTHPPIRRLTDHHREETPMSEQPTFTVTNQVRRTEDPWRISWALHQDKEHAKAPGETATTVYIKLREDDPVLTDSATLRAHMTELTEELAAEAGLRVDGAVGVLVMHPSNRMFERLAEGELLVVAESDTVKVVAGV